MSDLTMYNIQAWMQYIVATTAVCYISFDYKDATDIVSIIIIL